MSISWNLYWEKEANRNYWLQPDNAVVEQIDKLDRSKIKDTLDLGCGIGRHAMLLAEKGFQVTAVDSSPEALSILRSQIAAKGMRINIILGDYSQNLFQRESFDFILAYNVLYHGYRENFQKAIHLIYRLLRPGGLFFFTCPTRHDGKYGSGNMVASNTFKPLNSIHPGDIHYFADEADIANLLHNFSKVSKTNSEHYWDNNGIQQFSSYWRILAQK